MKMNQMNKHEFIYICDVSIDNNIQGYLKLKQQQ